MKLEHVPIVIGVIVALLAVTLIFDAFRGGQMHLRPERRRRMRAERNTAGEALVGTGMLCWGAALIGADVWRYATLAVLVGFAMVVVGAGMNYAYLRELLLFRGAARRAEPGERPRDPNEPRTRIR